MKFYLINEALLDTFPSEREKTLLEMLSADLMVELEHKEIVLELTNKEATN